MKLNFRKLNLALICAVLAAVSTLSAADEEVLALKAQYLQEEKAALGDLHIPQDESELRDLAAEIEINLGDQAAEEKSLDRAGLLGPKSPDFITTHDGVFHSVSQLSITREYITLNDGLTWYVPYESDRAKTSNFSMVAEYDPYTNNTYYYFTDNILILNGSYTRYTLVNQTTGEKIGVNLVEPLPGQLISTYWVTDIIGDLVYLNDGSLWQIPFGDRINQLNKWRIGDSVALGLNDSLFACFNRNILINVRLNNHIKGNCIR